MGYAWFLYLLGLIILTVALQLKQKGPYDLPKIVWTHWHSHDPPEEIKKTVDRMRLMLPDWTVNFIHTDDYIHSIHKEGIPRGFETLSVQHQADWIRLKLLKEYGGCWIDSGIILNQSINNLYRDCVSNRADLLVFKNHSLQTNSMYPIAENWFIMAPAKSPIITLWLEEYEQAIRMGFRRYKDSLKAEGVDLQNLMKDTDDVYLTQHGCYQKVIQTRRPQPTKIIYHVAEDSMFKIQDRICKWDMPCIQKHLQDKALVRSIPYIKLRGADRKDVNILALLT